MSVASAQEAAFQRDRPPRTKGETPLMKEVNALEAAIYKLGHIQGFFAAIDYVNELNTSISKE